MTGLILLLLALPSHAATHPMSGLGGETTKARFDAKIAAATSAMQFDTLKAAQLAREAQSIATSDRGLAGRSVAIATATWLEGEAAMRLNRIDESGPLIRTALEVAGRDAPGSKLHGDLLLSFSRLQSARGHPEEALLASQNAFAIFSKLKIARSQAVALQSIGTIYQDAADFDRVLYYYKLAGEISPGDLSLGLTSSNNRSLAFRELGRFDEAIQEDKRALTIAEKLGSPLIKTRVLANLAAAQVAARNFREARVNIAAGLRMASAPEASAWRAGLLETSAHLALLEGHPDQAVSLVETALKASGNDIRSQPYRSLHETAYRAYRAVGDSRKALEQLEVFWKLEASSRALAASTGAKLVSARFDFANQNARIATLRSGQLRRDIELTKLNARQQAIILSALLVIATSAILFLFIYLRSIRRSEIRLSAANAALQRSNVDLEKALTAKSLFLATTSHEIRTPLNGVLGMAQVILADNGIKGRLRDQIRLIEGAGNTMKALVDDILDLAKMDAGEYEVVSVPVDPKALLGEVVRFWLTQAHGKNIDLSLQFVDCPDGIYSDPTRLRQVFFNLVSNAIKFTHSGSIKIVADVEKLEDTELFCIDVIDTGIGIAATCYDAIFDKFHQLDQSTTRQYGGSGLGLPISRHIVRALGGDITVSSVLGVGTRMRVSLPFRRTIVTLPHDAVRRACARNLAESRIVIAGASPIAMNILRAILQAHVAATAGCADIDKLGEIIAREGADIVLLDGDGLRTSGLDSFETANRLDNITTRLGARLILIVTPTNDPIGSDQASRSFDVVHRPISADSLLEYLSTVFSDANQRYGYGISSSARI